jgi:hypothetical protein
LARSRTSPSGGASQGRGRSDPRLPDPAEDRRDDLPADRAAAFLQIKSLILLIATSFLATIIVSFLHGLVPSPIVSITDALAGVIVGILALIWAVVILIGSINAVIQSVQTT